jgi:hypothetical protein
MLVFRDGTLVCSFLYTVVQSYEVQSPGSVEQGLRLHGKSNFSYLHPISADSSDRIL